MYNKIIRGAPHSHNFFDTTIQNIQYTTTVRITTLRHVLASKGDEQHSESMLRTYRLQAHKYDSSVPRVQAARARANTPFERRRHISLRSFVTCARTRAPNGDDNDNNSRATKPPTTTTNGSRTRRNILTARTENPHTQTEQRASIDTHWMVCAHVNIM